MTSRKWQVGFLMLAIVAVMAMPATAGIVAQYDCDSLYTSGASVYTPDAVSGWGDAQIATSGGLGMSVVVDPERGNVLQIDRNDSGIMHGNRDPFAATGEFKVEMWIKPVASDIRLLRKASGWTDNYFFYTPGGDLRVENDSRQVQSAPGDGSPDIGVWNHYALTGKLLSPTEAEFHMFKNGVEILSAADDYIIETMDPADAGTPLWFGNLAGKTQAQVGLLVDDYIWHNAVPEPSTFAMLVLGGLAMLIRRRVR